MMHSYINIYQNAIHKNKPSTQREFSSLVIHYLYPIYTIIYPSRMKLYCTMTIKLWAKNIILPEHSKYLQVSIYSSLHQNEGYTFYIILPT